MIDNDRDDRQEAWRGAAPTGSEHDSFRQRLYTVFVLFGSAVLVVLLLLPSLPAGN